MIKPILIMMILFITCLLFASVDSRSKKRRKFPCPLCVDSRNVTSVKIPRGMPLSTFETYWTNRLNHLVYFGWTDPVLSIRNGEVVIQRTGPSTFSRTSQGFFVRPVNSTCITFDNALTQRDNTATFDVVGANPTPFLQVFFSSCPTQYMWYVDCLGWVEGQNKCPIDSTRMALSVRTLDRSFILPWDAATKDLRSVGLSFATQNFNFGNTYGANGIRSSERKCDRCFKRLYFNVCEITRNLQ